MTTASTTPTTLVLTGSNNWFQWYSIIKSRASSANIWEHVDPDLPEEPVLTKPIHPTVDDAQRLANLSAGPTPIFTASSSSTTVPAASPDKLTVGNALTLLLSDFNYKKEEYKQTQKSKQSLLAEIQRTISANYLIYLSDFDTPYQALKALKLNIAPNRQARYHDIDKQYRLLLSGKAKGQSIETWLQKWETTHAEAVGIEHPDFINTNTMARINFIQSIGSVDDKWSSSAKYSFQEKEEAGQILPTFAALLGQFRQSCRTNEQLTTSTATASSFTTFQGKDRQGNRPTRDRTQTPKCPVEPDTLHWFSDCPYLNKACRPSGWTGNSTYTAKAKQLLEDSTFKSKVERSIASRARYLSHQARSAQASELPAASTSQASSQPRAYPASYSNIKSDNDSLLHEWILDSGSNIHLCNDKSRFIHQRFASDSDYVTAGKSTYKIEAYGTVEIMVTSPEGTTEIVTLLDVALVPGFMSNLVSFIRMNRAKVHWDTEKHTLYTSDENGRDHFCQLIERDEHWIIEHNPAPTIYTALPAVHTSQIPRKPLEATAEHWHRALGHPSAETISWIEGNVDDAHVIPDTIPTSFDSCEACRVSKAKRLISRRTEIEHPATRPLERLHYDLIQLEKAYNDDVWVSHFTCSYTKYHWLWTHSKKSQATSIIEKMINLAQVHHESVKFLHSDGEKSLGDAFQSLILHHGIVWEPTAPYTPDQNGLAERSGGVIIAKARAMTIAANLPTNLWPEAVSTSAYLLNRIPTKSIAKKTPFEALYQKKPSIAHLHIFGCRAYPLNPLIPRSQKLVPRAHIGFLVGYDSTNIFRIWLPTKGKVIRVRNVTFDENRFYEQNDSDLSLILNETELQELIPVLDDDITRPLADNQGDDEIIENLTFDEDEIEIPPALPTIVEERPQTPPTPEKTFEFSTPLEKSVEYSTPTPEPGWTYQPSTIPAPRADEISSQIDESNILPNRTRRQAHAIALSRVDQLSGFHYAFATDLTKYQRPHRDDLPPEPKNWKGLQRHAHFEAFKKAAIIEYDYLIKRETFRPTHRPDFNHDILPLLWVFRYKFDTDGFLLKHKARLCVRGDLQKTEQDTNAATLAMRVFRALMAITAAFDLETRQYDAINAFINSEIDEEIYVSYPEGLSDSGSDKCLLLLRGLYGLKQSPLLWLRHLTDTLSKLGLHPVDGVDCLFTNSWLILFFYVDDIVALFRERDQAKFDTFEKSLLAAYELRSLGELAWFLGIRITRHRDTRRLWLCQDSYIEKVATKFSISCYPDPKTPLPIIDIAPSTEQATAQQIFGYQQRIGSIIFATSTTRPDIAFASSRLAQFLKNPSPQHFALANRLISYLLSTKRFAIEYNSDTKQEIFLPSSDAAFADDSDTRKSSYGYLFQLFGGPIDWKASKQTTVTTSSTEAELLALSETARQYKWWNRFFTNIHFDTEQTTTIICDNKQTLDLINRHTPKLTTRLKHVEVHNCWLRQEVQANQIATKWVPTSQMPADGLTKALPRQKHDDFVRQLHLVNNPSV